MRRSLTDYAIDQIEQIHRKSQCCNSGNNKEHAAVLLELMQKHADEIKQLKEEKNDHYITETGDLLILCMELIKEANASVDEVFEKCYKRYHDKLDSLIENT